MRELTKSLGSFGWAMSLFGLKQLAEMLAPRAASGGPPEWVPGRRDRGPEAFDHVTEAAREHLGDGVFHEAFRSGDRIFRSMVDMMLGGGCSDHPPGWGPRTGRDPHDAPWSPSGHGRGDRPHGGEPGPRPSAPAGGWGPMPADRSSPAGPGAGRRPDGDPQADSAGARGWGPMPPVPPKGAPAT